MASHIGRRKFLATLGGAAAAWTLPARAQQPAMPVTGLLRGETLTDVPHYVTAFRQGLKEAGFVEGQDVAIEYRWAEGQNDRLPALGAVTSPDPWFAPAAHGAFSPDHFLMNPK
jgi:hypothetical protein